MALENKTIISYLLLQVGTCASRCFFYVKKPVICFHRFALYYKKKKKKKKNSKKKKKIKKKKTGA